MPLESPTFQEYMRPLLALLEREKTPIRARDAYERLASDMNLSPEQRAEFIPSGKQPTYKNRIGWARTYLGFAGLIETPVRGSWQVSEAGRQFLRTHEGSVSLATLECTARLPGAPEGQSG